jgi:hypothetical protein
MRSFPSAPTVSHRLLLPAALLCLGALPAADQAEPDTDQGPDAITQDAFTLGDTIANSYAGTLGTPAPQPGVDSPPEPDIYEEDAVPQAYPMDRYESMWDKNPFLLKTVVAVQPKESFAKDYALQYVIASNGVYRVAIFNRVTQERVRLEEGKPSGEFRLLKVNYDRDRNKTSVQIARGTETAEIRYDETVLSTPVTIQNTQALYAGENTGPDGSPIQGGMPGPMDGRQMQGQPQDGQVPVQQMPGGRPGAPSAVPGRPGGPPGLPRPGMPGVPAAPAAQQPGAQPAVPSSINNRRRQLIPAPAATPPPKTTP